MAPGLLPSFASALGTCGWLHGGGAAPGSMAPKFRLPSLPLIALTPPLGFCSAIPSSSASSSSSSSLGGRRTLACFMSDAAETAPDEGTLAASATA